MLAILDFQYIDQVCDEDLGEIESLNEVLSLIDHIPKCQMSENSYKIYENQETVRSIGSVRFNIVEHTCEVKHMNQNRKGNQDFGQKEIDLRV